MNNKSLTIYIIGNNKIKLKNIPSNVEILTYKKDTNIENSKGEYIAFIDSEDCIAEDYFNTILTEINNNNFDICYINYKINYNFKRQLKIRPVKEGINNLIPMYDSYIWNYVFKKEHLLKIKNDTIKRKDFEIISYIKKQIYIHNIKGNKTSLMNMVTRRNDRYLKNIIYVGEYCNGLFNGYITWLIEIGKAFPEFDITILYTKINEITKNRLEHYFKCEQYKPSINYICNRLLTTYSTYFYPTNIFSLEENSTFIHGNMTDYKDSARFTENIYDRYIAVSQTSRDKAIGYFPTDNIEYIYNPYTYEECKVKPHLKLVSALRNAPEKGMDRIKQIAKILDEEKIPYTWSIFTDILEPNQGGLIFRQCITNVIDYVADADYLVQLSKSEALSYSLTEALCAKTKVITTDLPSIYEVNIEDKVNGIIIPLEYFEEENKSLLKDKILEAYKNKNLKFDYTYDKKKFNQYKEIFSK